eukprot:CAMPEP_0174710844 /NCGR_PEP_ID=MMETSP1094-20130205/12345_1 /TAXON_ID=156173 /ORGANISM="Chrysochromulina brevifilum, Strain UTEX LB 985" /LENGTH=45 /DNA_ID= /DNA_START= /DNA_END= /DNA_ORIENTATION=
MPFEVGDVPSEVEQALLAIDGVIIARTPGVLSVVSADVGVSTIHE